MCGQVNGITSIAGCRAMNIENVNCMERLKGSASIALMAVILLLSANNVLACSKAAWTGGGEGNPLPLGVSTNPAGEKYESDCGLTVDLAETTLPAFVSTDAPSDESTFSARFYFLASDLVINSGEVTLFRAMNGETPEVEVRIGSSGSGLELIAYYRDGGVLTPHGPPEPIQGVWHGVELTWSSDAVNGSFRISLDDFPPTVKNDLDNPNAVVNSVDFGIVNAADVGANSKLVLDAFEMRRTEPVGLLPVNEMFGISTRSKSETGDNIIIGGFIVEGTTDKCVVIRGRGPSVGVGLPLDFARLPNPFITLFDGGAPIETNDDWGTHPQSSVIENLGLEPGDPLDSAIYRCLEPGPYTVHLYDVANSPGIGIVEIFDADSGTPYLFGISTRSKVETDDRISIGGFIVEGDTTKQILIRGRGPSMASSGLDVNTLLSDPTMTLFSGATPIYSNDDWQTQDAGNATEIADTGIPPDDAAESAILMDLEPGAYTVHLKGVGNGTGIGIVEVFDMTGGSVAPQ